MLKSIMLYRNLKTEKKEYTLRLTEASIESIKGSEAYPRMSPLTLSVSDSQWARK